MAYSADVDVASFVLAELLPASSITLFQDFCRASKNVDDEDDTEGDDAGGGVADLVGVGKAGDGVGVLDLGP